MFVVVVNESSDWDVERVDVGTAQNVDENKDLPRRRRRVRERVDGPRHIEANSGGPLSSLSD